MVAFDVGSESTQSHSDLGEGQSGQREQRTQSLEVGTSFHFEAKKVAGVSQDGWVGNNHRGWGTGNLDVVSQAKICHCYRRSLGQF